MVSDTVRKGVSETGRALAIWLAERGLSTFQLIVPMIVFISILGALLTNHERTVSTAYHSIRSNQVTRWVIEPMRLT